MRERKRLMRIVFSDEVDQSLTAPGVQENRENSSGYRRILSSNSFASLPRRESSDPCASDSRMERH